jgi:hypothetical protein
MKNIFYSTKLDKNKNKLTVGYLTSKNRDRYGGDGSKQDTVFFADFNSEGKLALFDTSVHDDVKGHVMRAMIVNNGALATDSSGGNFVLYAKLNDVWSRTPFSFGDFSAANSAMKTMISQYQAMLVRDESETKEHVTEKEDIYDADLTIGE